MYGFQLLHYGAEYNGMNNDYTGKGFNQIEYVLNLLKNDPNSRRIIMTTFNPGKAHEGVLYPCHGISIQFYVNKGYLSCSVYIRSNDFFLGNPFNIASYALLVHIFCELIGNLSPGNLIINIGDVHIYEEHIEPVKEQLSRIPYNFPQLEFKKKIKNINDIAFKDIKLINYNFHKRIKAKMIA